MSLNTFLQIEGTLEEQEHDMTINHISLMDAYLIETIRNNGCSNEELIKKTLNNDLNAWKEMQPNFDFNRLLVLARDEESFKSIIEDGYKIKFVTINGVKNLLKLKFQISHEQYQQTENGIIDLDIDEEQFVCLKQVLSDNWQVNEISRTGSNLKVNIVIG